jgi:hypothetical protein
MLAYSRGKGCGGQCELAGACVERTLLSAAVGAGVELVLFSGKVEQEQHQEQEQRTSVSAPHRRGILIFFFFFGGDLIHV